MGGGRGRGGCILRCVWALGLGVMDVCVMIFTNDRNEGGEPAMDAHADPVNLLHFVALCS